MNNSEEPTITVATGNGLTRSVYLTQSRISHETISSSVGLPIEIFHYGEYTYMSVGPKVMKLCERTLPETEVADIVGLLSWEQIESFQEAGLRQDLIEWCLDNNIHKVPQWRRVSLVTERAERNIAFAIDDSCRAALSAITMAFHKARVKFDWYPPSSTWVALDPEWHWPLYPHQQASVDSLMRQGGFSQSEGRFRHTGEEPPKSPLIVKADASKIGELQRRKANIVDRMRRDTE